MSTRKASGVWQRRMAAVAVMAVALAGCSSIPTESEVQEGDADISPVEPLQPIQEGPGATDGPAAIVTGFLTASAGGVATDFSVAREFLTPEAARGWDPAAQTLVYDSGAVTPEWDEETSTVTYAVPLASTVDDSGRRLDAAEGEVADLSFTVSQDAQGRWRISELDDGIVLSEANFTRFYRGVDLVFSSMDRTTIVPELRWLPNNNVATYAARELVEGPSPWLADAVLTGFPATAALAVDSVVVSGGVATVGLTPQSAGTPEERSLASEQMRATLSALPGITRVEVRIGGLPIGTTETVTLANAPLPDSRAAALVGSRLGIWDGERLWVTTDDAGSIPANARGVAKSYEGDLTAFVSGGDLLMTDALADGPSLMNPPEDDLEPPEPMETTVLHQGSALAPPTWDRHGYVWTAERNGSGGLMAIAPNGDVISLASDWLQTRSVIGLSMSRDGTRIALLSRSGGQPVVEVAGVIREADGTPTGVGEPVQVGTGVGAGVDIVWIDDVTVGVLSEPVEGSASPLWQATVGGGTSFIVSLSNATDLAVRSGEASLLVVAADGHVEERSGSAWATVAQGVTELAFSG